MCSTVILNLIEYLKNPRDIESINRSSLIFKWKFSARLLLVPTYLFVQAPSGNFPLFGNSSMGIFNQNNMAVRHQPSRARDIRTFPPSTCASLRHDKILWLQALCSESYFGIICQKVLCTLNFECV